MARISDQATGQRAPFRQRSNESERKPGQGGVPVPQGVVHVSESRRTLASTSSGSRAQRHRVIDLTTSGEDEYIRLLRLLATGCKDETAARELGISVRTLRRRVAKLMADLQVETRLQLGAEAVRRGML